SEQTFSNIEKILFAHKDFSPENLGLPSRLGTSFGFITTKDRDLVPFDDIELYGTATETAEGYWKFEVRRLAEGINGREFDGGDELYEGLLFSGPGLASLARLKSLSTDADSEGFPSYRSQYE